MLLALALLVLGLLMLLDLTVPVALIVTALVVGFVAYLLGERLRR